MSNDSRDIPGYRYDSLRNRYFRIKGIKQQNVESITPDIPNYNWNASIILRELGVAGIKHQCIRKYSTRLFHRIDSNNDGLEIYSITDNWILVRNRTDVYKIPGSSFSDCISCLNHIQDNWLLVKQQYPIYLVNAQFSYLVYVYMNHIKGISNVVITSLDLNQSFEMRVKGIIQDSGYCMSKDICLLCCESRILLINPDSNIRRTIPCQSDPMAISIGLDESIYYGSRNGDVRSMDLRAIDSTKLFQVSSSVASIYQVNNPYYLLTSTYTDEIFLWDLRRAKSPILRYNNQPASCQRLPLKPRYTVNSDGTVLISSFNENSVATFDLMTGNLFGIIINESRSISSPRLTQVVNTEKCSTTFDFLCIYDNNHYT
jgi:hypothetical protein